MTSPAEPTRAASSTDLEARLARAEAALAYKSGLLDAILERMVQGLMLVNTEQTVEVCNRRAIELLGLPPALMARRPRFIEVLEYQWSTDEFSKTPAALKQFVRDGGILNQSQCYERMRPDGRVIEVQSVPLDGGGVLRTYTDVTVRHHDEAKLRHRARHDGLTSLLNRETFIEQLAAKIADVGSAAGFAVHYVDLDKFKPINDRLGHLAGDRVLAIIADRMRAVARDGDAVARLGGDEFAILQSGVDDDREALGLAERLIQSLAAPIALEGRRVEIGSCIGVALHPRDGTTVAALMEHADTALYRAKSLGGNRISVFEAFRAVVSDDALERMGLQPSSV